MLKCMYYLLPQYDIMYLCVSDCLICICSEIIDCKNIFFIKHKSLIRHITSVLFCSRCILLPEFLLDPLIYYLLCSYNLTTPKLNLCQMKHFLHISLLIYLWLLSFLHGWRPIFVGRQMMWCLSCKNCAKQLENLRNINNKGRISFI